MALRRAAWPSGFIADGMRRWPSKAGVLLTPLNRHREADASAANGRVERRQNDDAQLDAAWRRHHPSITASIGAARSLGVTGIPDAGLKPRAWQSIVRRRNFGMQMRDEIWRRHRFGEPRAALQITDMARQKKAAPIYQGWLM